MSTPFPLEEATQSEVEPTWNPWKGPPKQSAFAGLSEDYFGLSGAGSGVAKVEGAVMGAAHTVYGDLAEDTSKVPVVGAYYKWLEERAGEGEQDARERVHAMTPDPTTTGAATQFLHGFAEVGTEAAAGAGGGALGSALVAASGQASWRYQELREAGVPEAAAREAAAATAVTTAAGVMIPGGFGSKLATRALSGSAANIALGGVSRAADSEILHRAGFDQMADQEKVLDTTQILVDGALGGFFGFLHRPGAPAAADAAMTANLALADRRRSPGVPVDPGSAGAHQAALEQALTDLTLGRHVNVADTGVEQGTFARRPESLSEEHTQLIHDAIAQSGLLEETAKLDQLEQALGRRERGEPEPEVRLEDQFRGELEGDYQGAKARYAALDNPAIADTDGGRILNVDMARELSGEYVENRARSAEVHEPASEFVKKLYAEKLGEEPAAGKEPLVLFTAGGTGAGKTTAIESVPGVKALSEKAQIVYDTNMNKLGSATQKVEQALKAGKDVHIAYVYRDPEEALRHGALPRAMRMGRTVPIEEHAKTHAGSFDVIKELQRRYAGNDRVSISVIDNTRGRGQAALSSMEKVGAKRYNIPLEELRNAVEEEFKAKHISERVRAGTLGEDQPGSRGAGPPAEIGGPAGEAGRTPPGSRPEPGGQPERERSPPGRGTPAAGGGKQLELPGAKSALEHADQALSERPDLKILTETGEPTSARDALDAADSAVEQVSKEAPGLLKTLADCFLRRGT